MEDTHLPRSYFSPQQKTSQPMLSRCWKHKSLILLRNPDDHESIDMSETFESVSLWLWKGMSNGMSTCTSLNNGARYRRKGFLFGYDLCDAVLSPGPWNRVLKLTKSIETWELFLYEHDIHLIFTSNLGAIITPTEQGCTRRCCLHRHTGTNHVPLVLGIFNPHHNRRMSTALPTQTVHPSHAAELQKRDCLSSRHQTCRTGQSTTGQVNQRTRARLHIQDTRTG